MEELCRYICRSCGYSMVTTSAFGIRCRACGKKRWKRFHLQNNLAASRYASKKQTK